MRPPLPNQSRGSRASELLELLRDSMESAGLPRPLLPGCGAAPLRRLKVGVIFTSCPVH